MSRTDEAARSWLASSAAALGIVVALGALPTARLAGREGFTALAVGVAIAWLAAALGALPVLRAVARGGSDRPVAVVGAATAWRAGATVVGALVAILGTDLPRTALVIWLGLGYGALLVAETRWTTRWLSAGGA